MFPDIKTPDGLKVISAGNTADISLQKPVFEDPFLDLTALESKKKGVMLNPKYLKLTALKPEICAYYRGLVMINLKNRQTGKMETETAILLQSDEGCFVTSSFMLVDLFRKECTSGNAYFIVYTGEKTTSRGNTMNTFDVFPAI